MAQKVYYDRRNVNATEVQFFHQSRAEATNKEITTNMVKAKQFIKDTTIKKIAVVLSPTLISSATARDGTLDDQIKILLEEAIVDLQVADGDHHYIPLCSALAPVHVNGFGSYTLATAGDGTYAMASIGAGNGHWGIDVNIRVPKDTDLAVFVKTASVPAFGTTTMLLYVEE